MNRKLVITALAALSVASTAVPAAAQGGHNNFWYRSADPWYRSYNYLNEPRYNAYGYAGRFGYAAPYAAPYADRDRYGYAWSPDGRQDRYDRGPGFFYGQGR